MGKTTTLNPILLISSVSLSPRKRKDDNACFRQCLLLKSGVQGDLSEKDFKQTYLDLFINDLDRAFVKDDRFGKGITSSGIKISDKGNIISGVIKGGKYNIAREKGNIDNYSTFEKINKTDIILDSFFFLLYTPLDRKEGFLMVQVYTEESIYDVFSNYIKDFFSVSEKYYRARILPFMPDRFIKAYKKGARVNSFTFQSSDEVGDLESGGINSESIEYNVSIKITPKVKPSPENYGKLLRFLHKLSFGEKKLNEYSGSILLADANGKEVRYSMENSIESIRPTIYLNEYVQCNDDSGAPVFSKLEKFCKELLTEIIKEQGGESEIKRV